MRLRLVLSFILIVLVSVTSMAVVARRSTANELRSFMVHGGMIGVEDLAKALESYYAQTGSWAGVEQIFPPFMGGRQGMGGMGPGMMENMAQSLVLADHEGYVIYQYGKAHAERLTRAEIEQAIELRANRRRVGFLLPDGGIPFSPSDELALLNRLNRSALIAAVFAGIFSLLLALLLAYTLLRPVRALTRAARSLGQGDLSQRVTIEGDDELAGLGQAFNHMAITLEQEETRRKALTADIAHELRTPLAIQRAQLEAMQDGVYPLNREGVASILEQNQMLTRLVEDLRTLALADSGQLSLEQATTDFAALVERMIDRLAPQAGQKGVVFHFRNQAEQAARLIEGDPMRLEQVLNNLFSNALRYSPENSPIELNLHSTGKLLVLTLRDRGPGIPPEALPQIFERFYRADKSRSRLEGGTGLGLSIARQLVLAHGGDLTARNHPQGGAELTLTLPGRPS